MFDGKPELLQGLSPAEAGEVVALGSRVKLTGGMELFGLGSEASHLYLISQGRIKLTLPMQVRGRNEEVFVEECLPGQTVGWSALIPPYRFTLRASAMLDTEAIALPREALLAYFAANPKAGLQISTSLASLIGQRLQLFQTMWLREIQRLVEARCA